MKRLLVSAFMVIFLSAPAFAADAELYSSFGAYSLKTLDAAIKRPTTTHIGIEFGVRKEGLEVFASYGESIDETEYGSALLFGARVTGSMPLSRFWEQVKHGR